MSGGEVGMDEVGLDEVGLDDAESCVDVPPEAPLEAAGLAAEQNHECTLIDPQALVYVGNKLLEACCEALVNGAVDPAGKKAGPFIDAFVGDISAINLPPANSSGDQSSAGFGRRLQAALNTLAVTRRTTWKKMFGQTDATKRETKLAAAQSAIDGAGGLLPPDKRTLLAEQIIRRLDVSGEAHCTRIFPTRAGLEKHQLAGCLHRAVQCRHEGCTVKTAARHLALHEDKCGRRPIQCTHNGGCGAMVAAEDWDAHVQHLCSRRIVDCPFRCIGCSPPGGLFAEALAMHCHGPPPTSWMKALAAASAPNVNEYVSADGCRDVPWNTEALQGPQRNNLTSSNLRSDPEAELDINEGVHHHLLLAARAITAQRVQIDELRKELATTRAESRQLQVALQTLISGTVAQLTTGAAQSAKEIKTLNQKTNASKTITGKLETRIGAAELQLKKVTSQLAALIPHAR